jgi:hypothetical protein
MCNSDKILNISDLLPKRAVPSEIQTAVDPAILPDVSDTDAA